MPVEIAIHRRAGTPLASSRARPATSTPAWAPTSEWPPSTRAAPSRIACGWRGWRLSHALLHVAGSHDCGSRRTYRRSGETLQPAKEPWRDQPCHWIRTGLVYPLARTGAGISGSVSTNSRFNSRRVYRRLTPNCRPQVSQFILDVRRRRHGVRDLVADQIAELLSESMYRHLDGRVATSRGRPRSRRN